MEAKLINKNGNLVKIINIPGVIYTIRIPITPTLGVSDLYKDKEPPLSNDITERTFRYKTKNSNDEYIYKEI